MNLAIKGARLGGETVGLRAEDGAITELGAAVEPRVGDEVIEASGLILAPPLINAHTHAAMTLFRGYGDDLPLMEWLESWIWPAEAKLKPEDVYWGTRLAAVEMIRSGTTRFFDMYWHGAEVARAVTDAGLRAVVSSVMIDRLDPAASPRTGSTRSAGSRSPGSPRWRRSGSCRCRSTSPRPRTR
jgi:5-methylthioadenosine/S-adenosylhomocysteine deaminase